MIDKHFDNKEFQPFKNRHDQICVACVAQSCLYNGRQSIDMDWAEGKWMESVRLKKHSPTSTVRSEWTFGSEGKNDLVLEPDD